MGPMAGALIGLIKLKMKKSIAAFFMVLALPVTGLCRDKVENADGAKYVENRFLTGTPVVVVGTLLQKKETITLQHLRPYEIREYWSGRLRVEEVRFSYAPLADVDLSLLTFTEGKQLEPVEIPVFWDKELGPIYGRIEKKLHILNYCDELGGYSIELPVQVLIDQGSCDIDAIISRRLEFDKRGMKFEKKQ